MRPLEPLLVVEGAGTPELAGGSLVGAAGAAGAGVAVALLNPAPPPAPAAKATMTAPPASATFILA